MKKDLKEKDNVIEEKEEEMYLLNEKLEQQQVAPLPTSPPLPPLLLTTLPIPIPTLHPVSHTSTKKYVLNEELEQQQV